MARADSISTTRRTFVRLASAAAAFAVVSTPALAEDDDQVLIELAQRLMIAMRNTNEAADDESAQRFYCEGKSIFDEIFSYSATTIAGARAKAHGLLWIHGEDADGWDCKFTHDVIEDLLAITASAGR